MSYKERNAIRYKNSNIFATSLILTNDRLHIRGHPHQNSFLCTYIFTTLYVNLLKCR